VIFDQKATIKQFKSPNIYSASWCSKLLDNILIIILLF